MAAQSDIMLTVNFTGQANEIVPRLCRLYCPNNTGAEVTSAGFLDNYLKSSSQNLLVTDMVFTIASNGAGIFRPVFTNGSCQLVNL